MSKSISVLLIMQVIVLSCGAQRERPDFESAPGAPFAVGKQPRNISVADVNNDRKLDVVTANEGSRDVTILLGDGRGAFKQAPGSPFEVEAPVFFVAMGDLNKDGNLDLAMAQHDESPEVIVLLGDGKAGFKPAPNSPFIPLKSTDAHYHGLVLADVNWDGALDMITANGGSNASRLHESVSVSLGDGKGHFKAAAGSPVRFGRLPGGVVVADVNQDDKLDIIVDAEGRRDLILLLGDGRGGFRATPDSPIPLVKYSSGVAVGDLNNDGRAEIVVGHDDNGLLTVLSGEGNDHFKVAEGYPIDLGYRGSIKFVVDTNQDGKADLIFRGPNNSVTVLLGDGRMGFKQAPGSPFPVGKDPFNMAIGDINADGRLDILTANHGSDNVTVLLGK
ncbi:MAG: VCBS repeat-containing protein [Acidobacteria bacterium]|nr:VCBS repeat-containing protein [Acidobacteriota bacterium]